MSIQIKRGMKKDLPQLKDGELAFCRYTKELFVGNNGNENVSVTKKIEDRLDVVDSQLGHIEKHNKVFVNIKDFEKYKVGDDWSDAIDKAVDYINTMECFELYFPPGTYKVTRPIKSINRIGCICGNSKLDTIIEYTPTSDSTLLSIKVNTTLTTYFFIKDITFKCTSKTYKVNGIVCSKGEISQNLWGAGISIERSRVLGFTGVGIKIYAPFMSKLDTVYVGGSGYTSKNNRPTGMKPIGIEMTGNENSLSTFGNVNSISNCMIANCCYGIKLVSVGNVEINTTTLEPNFINLYAYNPQGSDSTGYSDYITLNNCWFENYNNDSHTKYGAICNYEFDETTGDIKQGLPIYKRGIVYLNSTLIHKSTPSIAKVVHNPGGGTLSESLINNLDQADENINIFSYGSSWGNAISIGTTRNYLHASTMFGKGTQRKYSNKTQSWVAGREATYFVEKNISSPVAGKVYTATFTIPSEFEKPEVLEVKALIGVKISGGNMMYTQSECKIFNLSSIINDTNKTTVLYNPWGDLKEIETGFIGSLISYDKSTNTISFNVKSNLTYGILVNLELTASYLGSQMK